MNHAPVSTTTKIEVLEPRRSGSAYLESISHTCGIAWSFARGRIVHPKTVPPSCGPIHL